MASYNRFDDETHNLDEAEVERLRERREVKRRDVMFIAKMLIYHVAACIIYIIIFSPASDAEMVHDTSGEAYILSFFSLLAIVLFSFIVSLELSSKGELRRDFTDRMKTESFDLKVYLSYTKRHLGRYGVIYLIFQIPFVIFHLLFGFEYVRPTVIDNLYTMDAGLMELTRFAPLGAVLNVLLFVGLLALFNYITLKRWKSEML